MEQESLAFTSRLKKWQAAVLLVYLPVHVFGLPLLVTEAYDRALCKLARREAAALSIPLREGVYAFFTGPCFETAAEIRAFRVLGADGSLTGYAGGTDKKRSLLELEQTAK